MNDSECSQNMHWIYLYVVGFLRLVFKYILTILTIFAGIFSFLLKNERKKDNYENEKGNRISLNLQWEGKGHLDINADIYDFAKNQKKNWTKQKIRKEERNLIFQLYSKIEY